MLTADDPGEQAVLDRVAQLADDSRRAYELGAPRRVAASAARGTSTDVAAVDRFVRAHEVIDATPYDPLDLDTTHQSPERSAAAILGGAGSVRR